MLKDKKVIKRQWKKLYDEKGAPYLEQVGEIDFNKEVASHSKSVDLKEIIKRYQAGETDILNQVQGVYSDITDTPTDLIYLNETIQKAEASIKTEYAKFDGKDFISYSDYKAGIMSGKTDKIMNARKEALKAKEEKHE